MLGWKRTPVLHQATFLAVLAVVGAGCSFSFSIGDTPESVAQEVIEGELAEQLGVGDLVATCETPPNRDPGTTFACTSTSEIGEIKWLATMADEDTVEVVSTNLLTSDNIDRFEEQAMSKIEERVEVPLGAETIDCGSGPIVPGSSRNSSLDCILTDPDNGDVYNAVVEYTRSETSGFEFNDVDLHLVDVAAWAARKFIEGELAPQLGIGAVTATCEVPDSRDLGTTFTCTSPSAIGEIQWLAVIENIDGMDVSTTNLLVSADIVGFEEAAVDVLEELVGRRLGAENFECGSGPIALGPDSIINCALTDPDNGDVYDAELEILSLDTGEFFVSVADEPR